MSATPIPRTLAISLYGANDISTIRSLPGNRKDVQTQFLHHVDIDIIIEHIKKKLQEGKQTYIITPMINESENSDLENAIEVCKKMGDIFGQDRVGMIHSKLHQDDKTSVIANFTEKKLDVLVATSVIEVGINIPNATTIVILNADRFGVSQLHQMRGRVRRSDDDSYCFLISDIENEDTIARLKAVAASNDGFTLAEIDLKYRGGGEFFGHKQSGQGDFRMADLVEDSAML